MAPARRDLLGAFAGAGLVATAGCLDALPVVGDPPPYAKWVPAEAAGAAVGPRARYVVPGAIDAGSRPDELLGIPHEAPVRLPAQAPGVVIGDPEDAPEVPSVELEVTFDDLRWQFAGPASSFRVVHGGGVAAAARDALAAADGFERDRTHRGFDIFASANGFAPPVAVGDGSVVVPPRTGDLKAHIDVRRGDGRRIDADNGYEAMVDKLGTAAFVVPRPPHEALSLSGGGALAGALDGARGGGLRLSLNRDATTVRYVLLYADGTDPSTDAVRRYMTEQADRVRPASMHEAAEVSVSTTGRLAIIDASLPAADLEEAHLVFPV